MNEWFERTNERMDERVAQYFSPYSWLFWPMNAIFLSLFSRGVILRLLHWIWYGIGLHGAQGFHFGQFDPLRHLYRHFGHAQG